MCIIYAAHSCLPHSFPVWTENKRLSLVSFAIPGNFSCDSHWVYPASPMQDRNPGVKMELNTEGMDLGTQSGKERLGQPGRVALTYVDYHAVYGDCSHDIKGRSLLGRKAATNLDSMLESRDITLPTKVCLVKAMVFPAVMYRCESWTIKKAEHQRTCAFELWCWRRLLRVPWTARRSNQSILKEIISPGCSLEGLMLKLKLQYFGDLMWRTDSLEKTLMLGKIEGRRRRVWQRMRCLDSITDSSDVNSRSWWWTGRPGVLQSMGSQRVRHDWATELNWPESGIFRSANKRKIWFTIMDTNRAFL